MLELKVLCCVLTVLTTFGNAARILGIVPTCSYSHQIVFQPIWKELSLRGHQVTTITTDLINDPNLTNLTEINLHSLYELHEYHLNKIVNAPPFKLMFAVLDLYEDMSHKFLSDQQVQNLIMDESQKFDVVMVELGLMSLYAFAKRFNAPMIVIASMDAPSTLRSVMGSPTHPIIYPDAVIAVDDQPSLWDRLLLTGFSVFINILKLTLIVPSQQLIVDKYFGPNYPPIDELETHISLALVNSDPIFHTVTPLVPTIIQIGGGSYRIPDKPLPKELKNVLDAAESGFIYFSLGSNVRSEDLTKETIDFIIETFAELPYTVLWKFELKNWPNKPKNLITSKWFAQQEVFKHPNIKLLITQGGLQTIEEAIYNHIPMIGIPFMADQYYNVKKMASKGFGLSIDYKTLNKDVFKTTILEVINNPKYRNKIKELAEFVMDQPMNGLEKAVWWTEYVIRHNGTKHLRCPSLDIPFYQYYLLDVFAVVVILVIVLISLSIFVLKSMLKLIKKLAPSRKIKKN